ncbi:DNA mismatch repair protein - MLH1 family [Klebsormidium nitens]|uniref:DNA mismatch repair protein-MLH1 family n=1 Tax=Klebsormidium nitens TaxID=105231 RepID=A0A1Y1I943_KLENI|nr:DNA mismatch repair protein - MLH1 family [Klebsormidium nitens]|eukprot:GAQ87495.1 DNA mismatch repair protein - MLH1 family [Klebsormidium nitens]
MDTTQGQQAGRTGPAPIRRLDQEVVNRIAAGEVIQRPSSALKELIENSLDAGAAAINVVIKDGGLKMIQITDNGHGIRPADLPILCERHTTSKLKEFEDLQSISTLGFRGEALASITFVAHLSVVTMTAGQTHGYKATYKDGVLEGEPKACAAVKGTQITVENLFYNVTARRKAFKNVGEEYSRILDVISRFAVHNEGVSFSCKKHGENRADIHTLAASSRSENIRSVYGSSVARELIPIETSDDDPARSRFKMGGCISSANYSAKKTIMVLFINNRLVDCSPLKKACEAVYAAILPKASKPFLYMSITLPPEDVDVNVHPTKREVSFLNQEALIEAIQKAVEQKLLESNTSRTYYTQSLLPGVAAPAPKSPAGADEGPSQAVAATQKAHPRNMVRTDVLQPVGQLDAYVTKRLASARESPDDLAAIRRTVRQRRNPAIASEASELTSIQELLEEVNAGVHQGLSEIVRSNTFVGMADDTFALLQHKTKLFLANTVKLSKELMYQQVLRRFGQFNCIRLTPPAPLDQLLLIALDEEEALGRWQPNDGPKEEIAKVLSQLLVLKAEMLREYFRIEIDASGALHTLPLVLDQYSPDLDRLPQFALRLGNDVEWDTEKECFQTLAAAIAEFYAIHPPLVPRPDPFRTKSAGKSERGAADSLESPPLAEPGTAGNPEEGPEALDEMSGHERHQHAAGPCHCGDEREESGGGEKRRGNGASSRQAAGNGGEGIPGEGTSGGGVESGPGRGGGDAASVSEKEPLEDGNERGGEAGLALDAGRNGSERNGTEMCRAETEGDDEAAAEAVWAARDWNVQHLMFPAMRLFLKPQKFMATDGTMVQIASLENLYKIFERC